MTIEDASNRLLIVFIFYPIKLFISFVWFNNTAYLVTASKRQNDIFVILKMDAKSVLLQIVTGKRVMVRTQLDGSQCWPTV